MQSNNPLDWISKDGSSQHLDKVPYSEGFVYSNGGGEFITKDLPEIKIPANFVPIWFGNITIPHMGNPTGTTNPVNFVPADSDIAKAIDNALYSIFELKWKDNEYAQHVFAYPKVNPLNSISENAFVIRDKLVWEGNFNYVDSSRFGTDPRANVIQLFEVILNRTNPTRSLQLKLAKAVAIKSDGQIEVINDSIDSVTLVKVWVIKN